jgi:hypothetical protein
MIQVIPGPKDVRDSRQSAHRGAKVCAVREIHLQDIDSFPAQEPGELNRLVNGVEMSERPHAQPQDRALRRLHRPRDAVLTVEQAQKGFDSRRIQSPDQRDKLRLGAAREKAVNQETNSNRPVQGSSSIVPNGLFRLVTMN